MQTNYWDMRSDTLYIIFESRAAQISEALPTKRGLDSRGWIFILSRTICIINNGIGHTHRTQHMLTILFHLQTLTAFVRLWVGGGGVEDVLLLTPQII